MPQTEAEDGARLSERELVEEMLGELSCDVKDGERQGRVVKHLGKLARSACGKSAGE